MLIVKILEDQGNASEASDKMLGLSASFLYLGTTTACGFVKLSWNFAETVNLIDWIGMFKIGNFFSILKLTNI